MIYVSYISVHISFAIFSTLWKFSSTQHTYRLITLQILFYLLLLLNNIVDPVIIYTSTPISTSYLFAIQSYTAQTSRGVAIYSVQAQALPLPPSPLHTPTTHHFRYRHQLSIQRNLNHYIIIYSLRDISATNLAIFFGRYSFRRDPPTPDRIWRRIHVKNVDLFQCVWFHVPET
jgi:hypothetical protein